jgi:hypothetical protein
MVVPPARTPGIVASPNGKPMTNRQQSLIAIKPILDFWCKVAMAGQ